MNSDVYITILGRYVWAMVNSYHAVVRERGLSPNRIYICTEERFSDGVVKGKKALELINETYGIESEIETLIVKDVDLVDAGVKLQKKVNSLMEEGYKIHLDITPGRKPLVAAALLPVKKRHLNSVFYLEISDLKDVNRPYMSIPMNKQKLWDFTEVGP